MSRDEKEDNTVYKVVVNHEEQYSIWPADRENALGWSDGGINDFVAALEASLRDGSFVKLTLGKYRGEEAGLKNLYVRAVEVGGAERLSFLTRYRTKDVVKNY